MLKNKTLKAAKEDKNYITYIGKMVLTTDGVSSELMEYGWRWNDKSGERKEKEPKILFPVKIPFQIKG